MMTEHLSLGPTPADEPCVQVGDPDYNLIAPTECLRFIELIKRKIGPEPQGARLKVMRCSHDFGTYHEVGCYFDPSIKEAVDYAFRCESEAPTTWEG